MKTFYIVMMIISGVGTILPPLTVLTIVNAAFFGYWSYRTLTFQEQK